MPATGSAGKATACRTSRKSSECCLLDTQRSRNSASRLSAEVTLTTASIDKDLHTAPQCGLPTDSGDVSNCYCGEAFKYRRRHVMFTQ
jgi:hypothetical protein